MEFDEKLLEEKHVREEMEKLIPEYCSISFKLLDMLLAQIIVRFIRPIQSELRLQLSGALKCWKVDRVESYWYYSGRYTKRYVEVTFWYNDQGERRESIREHSCTEGEDWKRPEWAKNITQFNESLTA